MAFITIYVRTTGSDSNNGSSAGSAFLTAQAAFNYTRNQAISYPSNTYALDFGAGTYGGIILRGDDYSQVAPLSWPQNLQIKGAGAASTFLGGIDGNAGSPGNYSNIGPYNESQYLGASAGASINITSDKSINLGNITANGSPGGDDAQNYQQNNSGGGGSITLNNCIAGNITAQTGYLVITADGAEQFNYGGFAATQGGSISIYNSQVSVVEVSGLNDVYATPSGTIHLSNYSSATQLRANGGTSSGWSYQFVPTRGGSIYLQNYCTAQSASVSGGSMYPCENVSGENGGIISLTIHSTTTVSTIANGGSGSGLACSSCGGSPGQIIVDETSYATGPQAIDPTGQGACGICSPSYYAGCTDGCSCNYDSGASCSDGSCYGSCDGCGNPCNYHGACTDQGASCSGWDGCANYDDGSCVYDDGCGCYTSPWSGSLPDPQYVENGYSYYIGDRMGYRGTFVPNTSGANIPISKTIISSILGIPVS